VFEFWEQRYPGVHSGPVAIEVPAHGCRLFAERSAAGRPQVVGSTFHLLQGALELAGEEWDGEVLRIRLRPVAKAEGELVMHVPAGFGRPAAAGAAVRDRGDGTWALGLRLDAER
jgi:hypothetical protein